MKRLLIIHRALAPYRIDLFNELSKAFDCHIYFEYGSAFEQPFDQEELNKRINFKYGILEPGKFGVNNLRLSLFSLVRKIRPDVIMCSEVNAITAILMAARKLVRNPPVVAMCDDNLSIAEEMVFSRPVNKFFISRLDGIVGCDTRALELYREFLPHAPQLHYMPIVQDDVYIRQILSRQLKNAAEIRKYYGIGDTEKCILFVGRLAEEKNLEYLITQFDKLASQMQGVHLMLVGNGPLEKELKALASSLKSGRLIHFTGKKEGAELYAHYAVGDLFVLASKRDAFAAVVPEAMIAGLPCLISDIAGSVSMLDGKNGIKLDLSVENDLCNKLLLILPRLDKPFSDDVLKPCLLPQSFEKYIKQLVSFLSSI